MASKEEHLTQKPGKKSFSPVGMVLKIVALLILGFILLNLFGFLIILANPKM